MTFAAIFLAMSIVVPGLESTDWLSVLQHAGLIALAEVSESDDVAPEYRILEGVVGAANGDHVRVGVTWPSMLSGWPEYRGTGPRRIIFAVKATHDLNAITLETALPFLISEREKPEYLEWVLLNESDLTYLVGGPSPTFEDAVALLRQLVKADEGERRRILLTQDMLRTFRCPRAEDEDQAMCARIAAATTLEQLLDIPADALPPSSSFQPEQSFPLVAKVWKYAGLKRFRTHLEAMGGDRVKRLENVLDAYGIRKDVQEAADDRVSLPPPPPPPTHSDESIQSLLTHHIPGDTSYNEIWSIKSDWPSLAELLRFASGHCEFMIGFLEKNASRPDDWAPYQTLGLALLTGRACSPCPPALVGLAKTAKSNWAALAPTACRDTPDLAKLFATKRYTRLREIPELYSIVWRAEHDQSPALDDMTYVFARWADGEPSLGQGLANRLSIVLERKARAQRRAPPASFDVIGRKQYATYMRGWLEANADLFRSPAGAKEPGRKKERIWKMP